jgi:hypothetical protein
MIELVQATPASVRYRHRRAAVTGDSPKTAPIVVHEARGFTWTASTNARSASLNTAPELQYRDRAAVTDERSLDQDTADPNTGSKPKNVAGAVPDSFGSHGICPVLRWSLQMVWALHSHLVLSVGVLERELGVLRAMRDEQRSVDSLDRALEGHQRRELNEL